MTLEGITNIYKHTKADTLYVAIPSKIAQDSQFPFKNTKKVFIKVSGDKIIIEKLSKDS